MRLYHGTDKRIEHPDCKAGRKNLDFGEGFYTTLLREHAEGWARQVAFNNRTNTPVVNVYEFDKEAALSECRYLHFPEYDEAWMDFIVARRLSEHRPNHQMTFLKQELVDKYLTFVESIEL